MKVLFLSNTAKHFTSQTNHGIMHLSAAIKKEGHETAVSEMNTRSLRKDLNEFMPDILAYSLMSCNFIQAMQTHSEIKAEREIFSIFGGPHPTYFPEMIDDEGIDAVCCGEGEEALIDFLARYENNSDWENTPNFHVNREGQKFINQVRPLVRDLDELPFSDRNIYFDRFWETYENPVKSFHSGRGCPYNCSYCYVASFRKLYNAEGSIWRSRSVDNILDEIEIVKSTAPLQYVRFYSDVFFKNKQWLEEFSIKYADRIGLPFWCMITPTMIDEKVVLYLKKAKCWAVSIGIEAGDEKVRNKILNRPVSDRHILNAIKLLNSVDLKVVTFNILGIPGSDLDGDYKLVSLNTQDKVTYSMATLLTPFPKTEVYTVAEELGLLPKGVFDYDQSMFNVSLLSIPDRKKVERLQKLLALAVSFKTVRHLLPVLLLMPLSGFYWLLYKLWMSYVYRFKVFPCKAPLKLNLLLFYRWIIGFKMPKMQYRNSINKEAAKNRIEYKKHTTTKIENRID